MDLIRTASPTAASKSPAAVVTVAISREDAPPANDCRLRSEGCVGVDGPIADGRRGVCTELTDRPGVNRDVEAARLGRMVDVDAFRLVPEEGTRDRMLAGVRGRAEAVDAPRPPYRLETAGGVPSTAAAAEDGGLVRSTSCRARSASSSSAAVVDAARLDGPREVRRRDGVGKPEAAVAPPSDGRPP